MSASMSGPRSNIERAKRHISEFESIVDSLVISKTTHPYAIAIEDDPDSTNVLYKLAHVPPVPDDVALVAGDAIHRMRSALDLLMSQLVERVHKGTHGKHTPSFPFDKTRKRFEARLTPEIERLVGKDALNVLRASEPYLGGKGEAAWYLHHLDVEDKHRIVYALGFNLQSQTLAFPTVAFDSMDDAQNAEFNRMVGEMMDTVFWRPADTMFPPDTATE